MDTSIPKNEITQSPRQPCCRLDQEMIMAVVRNRSGMDAGEIDYNLRVERFEKMSIGCLKDALKTLAVLQDNVNLRLAELITQK